MDESRDEQFEVLDVGGRSERRRGSTDPELPPIQLDDVPPEPQGDQPASWRQVGVVVGAMVLTVVATTLVLDARHESADNAAAGETVNLIVGEMQDRQGVGSDQTTALLNVMVHNAGPRDVDVLSIYPTGWSIPSDQDPGARTVAAGEWAVVPMPAVPSCDVPTPTSLEAEIRTEAGERAVTLDQGSGSYSPLGWIREALCVTASERDQIWMRVTDAEVLPADSDSLPMRLFIQADPLDGVVITGATTGTPGFDVEVVDAPTTLTWTSSATGVDVVWSISDCDDATIFVNADLQFQVQGKAVVDGDRMLPNSAVAAMARYALTVCDE